jgi:nucleoside transporter
MPRSIKFRLAIMMFIQYVVMGAIWPIMSLYLKDFLGFSGQQTGVVLAMSAAAAFVGPIVIACIADRLLSAERLLSVCHIGAACLMALISMETHFPAVALLYLAYSLAMGPTVALTNAIVFHNHPQGNRSFGNIRVWGTIGWIVVAWGFGFLWLRDSGATALASRLPDALKLSALASLCLALYALTLPSPKELRRDPLRILPVSALRLFLRPQILMIGLVSLLVGIVDRYYYLGMGPYLRQAGFSDAAIMPAMSLGQASEVIAMFALAIVLQRLGFKKVLLMGVLAETVRFAVFALGGSQALIICAIPAHGLAYTFYFTAVYIYIDSHTDRESRTGLHQLFSIITSGIGALSANLIGGACLDWFVADTGTVSFRAFWTVPFVLSLVALTLITLLFREKPVEP